jgi:hypothetical protein
MVKAVFEVVGGDCVKGAGGEEEDCGDSKSQARNPRQIQKGENSNEETGGK